VTPTSPRLVFTILPETFAVCRLDPAAGVPARAGSGPFTSVTRTADELSIICPDTAVPAGTLCAAATLVEIGHGVRR